LCADRDSGFDHLFGDFGMPRRVLPISKNVALGHSSASALSTALVLPGHGPSSNVKTTFCVAKEVVSFKVLKAEAGPGRIDLYDAGDFERIRFRADRARRGRGVDTTRRWECCRAWSRSPF
jgi:hypothetical protein